MEKGAALAAAIVLVAACASIDEKWAEKVAERPWNLVQLDGGKLLEGTSVVATFATDGQIQGRAVNGYAARCMRLERTLAVGKIQSTRMHVDNPAGAMAQESRYFSTLRHVTGWRMRRGRLELLRNEAVVLVFAR
jgi:heat shock protein HslJ